MHVVHMIPAPPSSLHLPLPRLSLPALQEKNWGGGFPRRWCWVQCNSFEGAPGCSVTAVGALRGLLGVPGVEENVGLVGIHHGGRLYEFLPNTGTVSWDVEPWGRWRISARNREHEALVEAVCEAPGTPLRAPTADAGLAPFCRDSFAGKVRGACSWCVCQAELESLR